MALYLVHGFAQSLLQIVYNICAKYGEKSVQKVHKSCSVMLIGIMCCYGCVMCIDLTKENFLTQSWFGPKSIYAKTRKCTKKKLFTKKSSSNCQKCQDIGKNSLQV